MEFNLWITSLPVFWAIAVTVAFNSAYFLFLRDRGSGDVTRARVAITVLIGTLIVVGTYADALSEKVFEMEDCLLLALVAAHGWTAEGLVRSFMAKAVKQPPSAPAA